MTIDSRQNAGDARPSPVAAPGAPNRDTRLDLPTPSEAAALLRNVKLPS